MISSYVLELLEPQFNNKILIIDGERLDSAIHYSTELRNQGFRVLWYQEALTFRLKYEDEVKNDKTKLVVFAQATSYIPYDLRCRFREFNLTFAGLFPKLNEEVLSSDKSLDLDLLCLAYKNNFDDLKEKEQTKIFIDNKVNSRKNAERCINNLYSSISDSVDKVPHYSNWFSIAETKARIDVLAVKYQIDFDTSNINRLFQKYILEIFGRLSTEINEKTPVLVSKAMEYMHDHSDKFVVIVMDGMSKFDWHIISTSFRNIKYEETAVFAMIPTTTSISRQCLLSNKYPCQLIEPWKQSKEKDEFVSCAKELGYKENQIAYGRGYNTCFDSFVCCGAVIINDIDDLVHAQTQGRLGMLNDVRVLASQHKLVDMTKRFIKEGFDVYISADHGNTLCTGLGKLMKTGVETETKSKRMLVLNNFADKDMLMQKYNLINYPKYYLNKTFDYLICNTGESFDVKGEEVMTHGGISLDEVVVPFIKIKAVDIDG